MRSEARQGADARCGILAATQHGLITLEQAIEAGLTRQAIHHRVATGRWERVAARVYRIVGVPRSWHQRAMASILSFGDVALYGRTAAAVHRFDGFPLTRDIELVSRRKLNPRAGVISHRSARLVSSDVVAVDGLSTTSASRTLIDLAGAITPTLLEAAFEDVLRRRLASLSHLQMDLLRFPMNHPGRSTLAGLVSNYVPGQGTESALEVQVVQLLRNAGYPRPVRQLVVADDGRFIGRVDLAWPQRGLVLEVEGFRWHSTPEQVQRDAERRNELTAQGLVVMQATKRSVRSPRAFLRSFRKIWTSLDPG